MTALTILILLTSLLTGVQAAEVRTLHFSLRNERAAPLDEIVTVSLPVPAGLIPSEPPQSLSRAGQRVAAQAAVITRHTDGSVRRLKVSFRAQLGATSPAEFTLDPAAGTARGPALARLDGKAADMCPDGFLLQFRDGALHLLGWNGLPVGTVQPFGPRIGGAGQPTLTVIENGPFLVWLRWRQDGSDYSREMDIQADQLGRVRLVQRILRHLKGNDWTPDFGFELSAPGAAPVRLPEKPIPFRALPVAAPLGKHLDLVAAMKLADGTPLAMANPLALRQHRGTLAASRSGEITTVRFSRLEPVAKKADKLLIQEGMWRFVEVVLQPGTAEELAAGIDAPVVAKADWRLFDAVYHMGPPLKVKHPVLKALVERYVAALGGLSSKGDDLGSFGGLERYNHCQYLWEDYFRSGDPRLRRLALDYSENYHNFSIYWGPKPEFYGGGRYPSRAQPGPGIFRARENNAITFCTKGYHGFWLAYEETGDPRFRYAAEEQAKWSSRYVHATVDYTRCIGQVTDFVKLYEYTGEKSYLANAVRLWKEFQACQDPDLLFNEAGVPSTGNALYVPEDQFGYKHPFVKSYIMQYATNSLPYLLPYRPNDKRLRQTIIACNDWMAKVQTAGGGWSYPGPTTAGFTWSPEYCHGLMLGYEVEPKPAYLDAVQRDLRAIVALYQTHYAIPMGVTPWEFLGGKTYADLGKMYRLGADRNRDRDFTDGRVSFGVGPDQAVYLQVLLRDYLRHRSEDSLFCRDKVLDRILLMPAQ